MRIYVVRHGAAIDLEDPKCPKEAERYLTREGIDKTEEVGRGLARLGMKADLPRPRNRSSPAPTPWPDSGCTKQQRSWCRSGSARPPAGSSPRPLSSRSRVRGRASRF